MKNDYTSFTNEVGYYCSISKCGQTMKNPSLAEYVLKEWKPFKTISDRTFCCVKCYEGLVY